MLYYIFGNLLLFSSVIIYFVTLICIIFVY